MMVHVTNQPTIILFNLWGIAISRATEAFHAEFSHFPCRYCTSLPGVPLDTPQKRKWAKKLRGRDTLNHQNPASLFCSLEVVKVREIQGVETVL